MTVLLAVAAFTIATGAGVLLAAYERPSVRRALVERLSLALVVAGAATLAAGLLSTLVA